MRYLFLAAHPDDEVLGCGGTIARLCREQHEVFVVILGEGVTSRYVLQDEECRSLVRALQENSKKAASLLGVQDLFLYDYPDNQFDTIPLLDIVKKVEEMIERIKPQIVYTHHASDLNIDHTITARATLTASRPLSGCPVKEIYAYEIPSSTEWSFNQFQTAFQPNVFVDIETTLEMKISAMSVYEKEIRHFPHPRSPETLRAIAARWGSTAGLKSAEAFQLIRSIR